MSVRTAPGAATEPVDAPAPLTLVVLCQDLRRQGPALDLDEIASWLAQHAGGKRLLVTEDLCHAPGRVREAVQRAGAARLVLAGCSAPSRLSGLQAQVRRAGVDPLGVQLVGLERLRETKGPATEVAKLLLAAAVARSQAFRGAAPQNAKAVFLSGRDWAATRRALFTLPPLTYVPVPTINRELCTAATGCRLCAAACPYGAIGEREHAIAVDKARCHSCGVCVTACPTRAVEFPGHSPEELEAQLAALLTTDLDLPQRNVVFLCKEAQTPPNDGWLPVQVSCLAMVPVSAVLYALARGANEVALASCGEQCPAQLLAVTQGKSDYCGELLQCIGGEPGRVVFAASSGMLPDPSSAHFAAPRKAAPPDRLPLWGPGAAAGAVQALIGQYDLGGDVNLVHPASPLGVVRIRPDVCTGCGACANSCPTGALAYQEQGDEMSLAFDPRLCVACGTCLAVCPEISAGAIQVGPATVSRLLEGGPQELFRSRVARCERCGAAFASLSMLRRIAAVLQEEALPDYMSRRCPDCRGVSFQS